MATPAEVVASQFAQAHTYAANATTQLTTFTNALNNAIYTPPSLSVTWNSIDPPSLPSLPNQPTLPNIEFADPTAPTTLALDAPTTTIDTFLEDAPTTTFPTAPTLSYGTAPAIPAVGSVAVPDAPVITMPAVPTYLSITTPTFAGVDLHTDYLAKLEDIPTLDLVEPTPYSYSPGPRYTSAMLDALRATLLERIAGGTGLPAAVEQALWDRARDRETNVALASIADVTRASEAAGFHFPTGVLAAQLREANVAYHDKVSGLSRDIAIKQADLEQENLKQTIAAGMQLEGQLIDYSYKLEQIGFESAKTLAENTIGIYNALVDKFKALLTGYQTYAAAYKTIIDAELSKVEVYKAQLQGEMAKAQVNEALVQQYKASIEAGMSQVEIYKAQVGAANTLVQIEQTKISAAAEQVRAFTATVNAETAKVEMYKAGVQAEAAKVETYRVKATAFSAKVGAQADLARAQLARFTALVQAKAAEWDGYKSRVDAERARIQALGTQSGALLDGYKAGVAAVEASANMTARVWETEIKNYEAGKQIAIQAGKINSDFIMQTNNARLEAAKAGAQVYAQLTSSAYGIVHATAGVSAGGGTSVSYSYSGTTSGSPPAIAVI